MKCPPPPPPKKGKKVLSLQKCRVHPPSFGMFLATFLKEDFLSLKKG